MTERLYYTDSYLGRFEARVVKTRGLEVILDRTAFYPTSGGQPFDRGRIGDATVEEVLEDGSQIVHRVDREIPAGPVACEIDWARRFDHMQQHSGQHLLSAVFVELFGCATVSFHLGAEHSTIDLAAPELAAAQIEAAEERVNALVFENRPVTARFCSSEEAAAIGLRKPSEREGPIRVVEIAGCDRSACGGTHVRATGEIGAILIRGRDRVRQNARIEFVCGARAVRAARRDFEAFGRMARMFSAPREQMPELVAAKIRWSQDLEKELRRLQAEIAVLQGRDLYRKIPADARGRRVYQGAVAQGALEQWRPQAEQFVAAGPGAIFLLSLAQPPAVLLGASPDLELNAGDIVKSVVQSLGGRGGGTATLAQGSLPAATVIPDALDRIWQRLG